jgi:hypothetical protein
MLSLSRLFRKCEGLDVSTNVWASTACYTVSYVLYMYKACSINTLTHKLNNSDSKITGSELTDLKGTPPFHAVYRTDTVLTLPARNPLAFERACLGELPECFSFRCTVFRPLRKREKVVLFLFVC